MARRRDALTDETLELLRTVVNALSRSARSIERRTGVTNAQLFLLRELDGPAGLSVNELAARARTRQGTVSTIVSRLVRHGLVHRVRSDTDRRRAQLTLTAAGRRVLRRAPVPPTAELLEALGRLHRADADRLARGLRALTITLGLAGTTSTMLFEERRDGRPKSQGHAS